MIIKNTYNTYICKKYKKRSISNEFPLPDYFWLGYLVFPTGPWADYGGTFARDSRVGAAPGVHDVAAPGVHDVAAPGARGEAAPDARDVAAHESHVEVAPGSHGGSAPGALDGAALVALGGGSEGSGDSADFGSSPTFNKPI